jgi:plasmid stabilization system protein ParE
MEAQLDSFGESAVNALMRTGHWDSPASLINDGLRVVKERHRLWKLQRREFVQNLLRPALKEVKRGRLLLFENGVLDQIKSKRPLHIRRLPGFAPTATEWEVQLCRSALRDLHYYWKHACDPSPMTGERFLRKVGSLLRSLKQTPNRGQRREELWPTLRSIGCHALSYPWFVIFFQVTNCRVIVLRIVHWTCNPPSRMSFP